MARKLDGNYITANTITTTQLSTAVVNQISAGGGGGPKVTTITYPNSATAAVNTGNESIVLTGTGFESGVQVYINGAAAPSVSRTNSTSLSFTTPALSTGTTYPLYVVNPDGGTAVVVPGMVVSSGPVWVTGSPLTSWGASSALSTTLVANSDSTVSYALADGSSLPSGLSLAANGLLSGTLTSPPAVQTTYNFTVTATDLELQKSSKAFSINATIGIQATGGTVSNIAGYRVHTFTSSGTFEVTSGTGTIEYLVVAGGGRGGYAGWGGGGGGAGGLLSGNVSVSTGTYTVTVGGGGSGTLSTYYLTTYYPGSNSSVIGSGVSITSIGGGYGSNGQTAPGGDGGSGGGAAQRNAPVAGGRGVYPGSSFINAARQGYDGGWVLGGNDSGGGGGGAGGAGANTSGSGGNGGIGLQSNISGTLVYYAGGGAGGAENAPYGGVGGSGGGGNTGPSATAAGGVNTGGGGGGGWGTVDPGRVGGSGGSGIVIIRYAA